MEGENSEEVVFLLTGFGVSYPYFASSSTKFIQGISGYQDQPIMGNRVPPSIPN
jgi:hypothetical protein